jgi:hypothetical protein
VHNLLHLHLNFFPPISGRTYFYLLELLEKSSPHPHMLFHDKSVACAVILWQVLVNRSVSFLISQGEGFFFNQLSDR